jgi:hypothetical protein
LELAHPGINRTYNTVKEYLSIPNLKTKIQSQINNCYACQTNKKKRNEERKSQGKIFAERPFQKIASDILGQIPGQLFKNDGTKFILTIIDIHSKWCVLDLLHDIKAKTIVKVFEKRWLSQYKTAQR